MTGRGNLLSLFKQKNEASEVSLSSGDQAKDSGLDVDQTLSSGENRRVVKDTVGGDLASALQNVNITIGRGRGRGLAHLLESCKATSQLIPSVNSAASASSEGFVNDTTSGNLNKSSDNAPSNQSVSKISNPDVSPSELYLPRAIYGKNGKHAYNNSKIFRKFVYFM